MIYLDNSSTTKRKPSEVLNAFEYYVNEVGVSPGRGSYTLGIEASRMLYKSRKTVAEFFGNENPYVVFTKNSTEAINMFFNGFLQKGDHVIISCYEHNAVFRPLNKLKEQGIIDYSIIKREDMMLSPQEIVEKYVTPNTKLFASTLASNVTGRIVLNKLLLREMKKAGIYTFIDSSQGAGKYRLSMVDDGIDFIAFTGHKDLMALPGVGGLCSKCKLEFVPLIQGGTGIHGEEYVNPRVYPEAYESGTLNMPAIWSLNAAINYIKANFDFISKKEEQLKQYLLQRIKTVPHVVVYDEEYSRVSTIGINILNIRSDLVVQKLDENGICVRGGIHCAILTHETLNTATTGIVRISFNYNNSIDEIDKLIEVLKQIGE